MRDPGLLDESAVAVQLSVAHFGAVGLEWTIVIQPVTSYVTFVDDFFAACLPRKANESEDY